MTGAAVTRVTATAAINGSKLLVTLVPGHYPFAQKTVSLSGLVSSPGSSTVTIALKATGARDGTGMVTVTGPNNSREPDVAVFAIKWSVATGNTGTLTLTQKPV